jgi:hypothetical protein
MLHRHLSLFQFKIICILSRFYFVLLRYRNIAHLIVQLNRRKKQSAKKKFETREIAHAGGSTLSISQSWITQLCKHWWWVTHTVPRPPCSHISQASVVYTWFRMMNTYKDLVLTAAHLVKSYTGNVYVTIVQYYTYFLNVAFGFCVPHWP